MGRPFSWHASGAPWIERRTAKPRILARMAQADDGCREREDNEMTLSHADAEALLFHESALLDSWKLKEWAGLFTDDGVYLVPPLDQPEGMPDRDLFLIYDDRYRLEQRA